MNIEAFQDIINPSEFLHLSGKDLETSPMPWPSPKEPHLPNTATSWEPQGKPDPTLPFLTESNASNSSSPGTFTTLGVSPVDNVPPVFCQDAHLGEPEHTMPEPEHAIFDCVDLSLFSDRRLDFRREGDTMSEPALSRLHDDPLTDLLNIDDDRASQISHRTWVEPHWPELAGRFPSFEGQSRRSLDNSPRLTGTMSMLSPPMTSNTLTASGSLSRGGSLADAFEGVHSHTFENINTDQPGDLKEVERNVTETEQGPEADVVVHVEESEEEEISARHIARAAEVISQSQPHSTRPKRKVAEKRKRPDPDPDFIPHPAKKQITPPPKKYPTALQVHIPVPQEPVVEKGVRFSLRPTVYEVFTGDKMDWCRYCGVTQKAQTAAFRPGPWGKRTLCNKHGCDYKGYGYIEKEPRLNLTAFENEDIKDRVRPILQDWCAACFKQANEEADDLLVQCDGCCRAYHQKCSKTPISEVVAKGTKRQKWYCSPSCETTIETGVVAIEVPKRNLPLMKSISRPPQPKQQTVAPAPSAQKGTATICSTLAQEALETIRRRKSTGSSGNGSGNGGVGNTTGGKGSKTGKKAPPLPWKEAPCVKKAEIATPSWTLLSSKRRDSKKKPSKQQQQTSESDDAQQVQTKDAQEIQVPFEDLSDEVYVKRHQLCEEKERQTRILA